MLLFLRALQRGSAAGVARPQGAGILQPERAAFLFLPHCAGVRIKGDILFREREYPPYTPKRKDAGPSPSTPDIAGLILERLHALRSVGAVYMASP